MPGGERQGEHECCLSSFAISHGVSPVIVRRAWAREMNQALSGVDMGMAILLDDCATQWLRKVGDMSYVMLIGQRRKIFLRGLLRRENPLRRRRPAKPRATSQTVWPSKQSGSVPRTFPASPATPPHSPPATDAPPTSPSESRCRSSSAHRSTGCDADSVPESRCWRNDVVRSGAADCARLAAIDPRDLPRVCAFHSAQATCATLQPHFPIARTSPVAVRCAIRSRETCTHRPYSRVRRA